MDTEEHRDDQSPPPAAPTHGSSHLRGSFVAVLAMAAFFCIAWFGMFALMLERR